MGYLARESSERHHRKRKRRGHRHVLHCRADVATDWREKKNDTDYATAAMRYEEHRHDAATGPQGGVSGDRTHAQPDPKSDLRRHVGGAWKLSGDNRKATRAS